MSEEHLSPEPQAPRAPDFEIIPTLQQAWEDTTGTKASIWGAVGITFIVGIAFGLVSLSVSSGDPDLPSNMEMLLDLISSLVSWVLGAGIMMMAVRKAQGQQIKAAMVLDQFPKFLSIIVLQIMMSILIAIGLILLVLPGIYLGVAYTFALPLMLDKKLGFWDSLETSRKMVSTAWFRYFFTYLLLIIVVFISAIPFGIGLIWTLPMSAILYGNLYQDAFK